MITPRFCFLTNLLKGLTIHTVHMPTICPTGVVQISTIHAVTAVYPAEWSKLVPFMLCLLFVLQSGKD